MSNTFTCVPSIDIVVDLPFVLASLIISATIWRSFPFWKQWFSSKEKTRNARRLMIAIFQRTINLSSFPRCSSPLCFRMFVLQQFLYWCLDIPATIASIIVLFTVYRARALSEELIEVLLLRRDGEAESGSSIQLTNVDLSSSFISIGRASILHTPGIPIVQLICQPITWRITRYQMNRHSVGTW